MSTFCCPESIFSTIVRQQRGSAGFSEYQELANARLAHAFGIAVRLDDEDRLRLMLTNMMEMGHRATACEIQVRANEKRRLVGLPIAGELLDDVATEHNAMAVKAAIRARRLLDQVAVSADDRIARVRDAFGQPQTIEAMAEARTMVVREFLEINIKPQDFEEVIKIWDEVQQAGRSFEGLKKYVDQSLVQFIERRGQPNRGNEPHSPLAWWKYVLIAVIIAAAIFGVVACFVWFGCSFIFPLLGVIAPWVFGIIDRGC